MLVGISDVSSMSRLYVTGSLELVLAKQDIEILFHRNVWTALLKIKNCTLGRHTYLAWRSTVINKAVPPG